MNWTEILAAAGIPESPGRQKAYEEAAAASAKRYAANNCKQVRVKRTQKMKH